MVGIGFGLGVAVAVGVEAMVGVGVTVGVEVAAVVASDKTFFGSFCLFIKYKVMAWMVRTRIRKYKIKDFIRDILALFHGFNINRSQTVFFSYGITICTADFKIFGYVFPIVVFDTITIRGSIRTGSVYG